MLLAFFLEHVDLQGQCLRLPDSKTGAKVVYLPPGVDATLAYRRGVQRVQGPSGGLEEDL